jgi:hypothetical protein
MTLNLWSHKKRSALFFFLLVVLAESAHAATNVLTYHYNNQRTGWNPSEAVLTPSNVRRLQLTASIAVDDQVDAQPLVYNGAVYVVTESNWVYKIDAASGSVIATTNLGQPVTTSTYGCSSGYVGITSTPVIDHKSETLYLIAYKYNSRRSPVFQLHALDTGSLKDKIAPGTVAASRKLTNGETYSFDASVTRQRPGLLLSVNGDVYAGFGSICDVSPNISRGWLMRWKSGSLAPDGGHLNNDDGQSTNDFFLTSIWMSGYGIAEDQSANLYFATGNSDPSGTSYNEHNLSESVIELSPNLRTIESFFTPVGAEGLLYMEKNDADMGSGGVLLTPDGYAVAAGKVGQMFLLRQGNLSGRRAGSDVAGVTIGTCFCGESYYQGPDGVGRIVSSGNNTIDVWLEPSLAKESESPALGASGWSGFFTSVSSNRNQNAIIWAVMPTPDSTELRLYAYDPAAASVVFSAAAGTWPNASSINANIVPVVANGHVYVASYKQLTIWGLTQALGAKLAHPVFNNPVQLQSGEHDVFGTITAINGASINIKKRDGTIINVNTTNATAPPLVIDEPVQVVGTGTATALDAKWVARAKRSPKIWFPDR